MPRIKLKIMHEGQTEYLPIEAQSVHDYLRMIDAELARRAAVRQTEIDAVVRPIVQVIYEEGSEWPCYI